MRRNFLRKLIPVATVGVVLGLTGCISATNTLNFANGEVSATMSLSAAAEYFTMNSEAESVLDGKELKDLDDSKLLELCELIRGENEDGADFKVKSDGVSENGRLNCSYVSDPRPLDQIEEEGITATYADGVYSVSVDLTGLPSESGEAVDKEQLKTLGVELLGEVSFVGGVGDVVLDDKAITEEAPVEGITVGENTVTFDYMKVPTGSLKITGFEKTPGAALWFMTGSAIPVAVWFVLGSFIAVGLAVALFFVLRTKEVGDDVGEKAFDPNATVVDDSTAHGETVTEQPYADQTSGFATDDSPLPSVDESFDPTPPTIEESDGSTGRFLD